MDKEKTKQALDRVLRDMAGAMTAGLAYVGTRTGLFRAMAGKGPMSVDAVVAATGLQHRYVEEWLAGMAAAGYLEYDAGARTFTLSEEMAYFVAAEGTDHYVGGMWEMVPPLLRVAPQVAEAFRTGGGVRFEEFGADCLHALDVLNRGQYETRMTGYWLKALPESIERLQAGGRMLDFGCGSGRVAMAIKKAFPQAQVAGYDIDPVSIARARDAAAGLGLQIDFSAALPAGGFDLITICDAVHDLAAPVETLRQARDLLAAQGTLFILEPKAGDRLEENMNPVGTMFYGFSVFHCMTQSLARGGPGLGTCMGPAKLEALAREAGFRQFRMLDLKSMTNQFYAAKKE